MEEAKQAIKNAFKEITSKKYRKRWIRAFIVVVLLVILLAGATYRTTVDDGTYKEDDWSSAPYAASQYTGGISVERDGTLKTGTTAQELWDKMLKNQSRVDEYLSNPEELARLMRAEIITQYPDTRPEEEIDKEIDWDEVIKNADLMQGIIKFKRANNDGDKSTMSYVAPDVFQGYIDEYNRSGSETAKQNALKHFTLKKTSGSSSSSSSSSSEGGVNYNGPDLYWPTTATYISSPFGYRGPMSVGTSNHNGIDIAGKAGDEVYACEDGKVTIANYSDSAGNWVVIDHGRGYVTKYMHNSELKVKAGDTVKKGQVIALEGSTGWSTGPHVHFQIEYAGVPINPLEFKYHNGQGHGTGGFGISDDESKDNNDKKDKEDKEDNKKEEKDKKDNLSKATVTPEEGDGYKALYTSYAGITYKDYKQFEGSYAQNPYYGNTIAWAGCGPSSVAILASGLTNLDYDPGKVAAEMTATYGPTNTTSYINLKGEMDSLGMQSEVIQSPSADTIQEKLKNGKVMLVSVNSNTIFTNESHLMTIVDINEEGKIYICNPGSSNASGHGSGWYDISVIMAGCQYIVVTEAGKGNGNVAPSQNTSNYVAVVATWRQVDTSVTTNDPGVQGRSTTQYTMTTTNVNYEEMVDPYTMPFDMLWALLVVGEDKKFIFELADLIYKSDIQITVHDNLTVNTDVDDWHYTQRTKAEVDASITATCNGKSETGTLSNDVHDPDTETEYNTTVTVVTQSNTLSVGVTRANVWIVDYENEYTYLGEKDGSGSSNVVSLADQNYPSTPDRTENTYSCEHINSLKADLSSKVTAAAKSEDESSERLDGTEKKSYPVSFSEDITAKYYSKYIKMYDNVSHSMSTQKYMKGVPIKKEKVDKETAPNFVTIFNKQAYRKNKINIKNASDWLFEIIETNDSTADMWPDLIRYLLYKATNIKYDNVDDFDFSIFEPGSFKSVNNGGGGTLTIEAITKTSLSEEEFVSLVQGYSDAISKGGGTAEFRNNAKIIYQVCVENNINPVFCAAQGWREQNWIAPNTSPHNYWGIAVYNGQNYGSSWGTMEQAVQAYCDQINSQATNSVYIERAKQYAALDSRFKGDMSTIYDVFSAYCYKGDEYSQAENAKYVGDYIDSLSTIAHQIFGVGLD